jgi:diacylglycerol O-acyltransferase / wax synthase
VARAAQVRVTDVLLSMVAGAVSGTVTPGAVSGTVTPAPSGLRVSTTLMVRAADSAAEGNATAAVMLTVPLSAGSDSERLAEIGRRSRNTQRATRALASRFVMSTVAAVLPPAVHAWFARTVYGHRFLQAIISNMPGPVGSYRMAGGRMVEVYPILPLAPRAPLALAAVGWDGTLFISLTVGPDLVEAGPNVADAARGVLASLVAQARVEASDAVSGAGAARP